MFDKPLEENDGLYKITNDTSKEPEFHVPDHLKVVDPVSLAPAVTKKEDDVESAV